MRMITVGLTTIVTALALTTSTFGALSTIAVVVAVLAAMTLIAAGQAG